MNENPIINFLQKYHDFFLLIIGIVLIIGAIKNWNWLCDPTGKPYSHRYGRGERRVFFFLIGALLVIISIWSLILKLKK